jgi:Ca2+/H+ antiporter, TMEM165/GDT1 family
MIFPSESPDSESSDPAALQLLSDRSTQSGGARRSSTRQVFLATFGTIFLAEMGDKTQLATMLMAAQSQSPWLVFLGSGLALVATSLLGVLIGRWLARNFPPQLLDSLAALLMIVIAILLLGEVVEG